MEEVRFKPLSTDNSISLPFLAWMDTDPIFTVDQLVVTSRRLNGINSEKSDVRLSAVVFQLSRDRFPPPEDALIKKLSKLVEELKEKNPDKKDIWEKLERVSKGKLRKLDKPVKDPLKDFLERRHQD